MRHKKTSTQTEYKAMNIFKALFGGEEETPEEKQKADEAKRFDMFKYDGVKAARMGQHDYAVKCYNEALAIQDDLETHDYIAQSLIHTDRLDEAMGHLIVLNKAQPDNKEILIRMADIAYLTEDYNKMSDLCARILEMDNECPHGNYLYARAHAGLGNLVGAVATVSRAIALDAGFGAAYLLRGQLLLKMGDPAGAAKDADKLIETYGENEDAMLLKARAEAASGHADTAINIYNKVTELNPFCTEAFRERGAVRYDMGDMKGAQADMQRVLELNPDQASGITGEYSAEGVEQKMHKTSFINPLGL